MAFRGAIHVGRVLLVGALQLVLSSSALAQYEPPPPLAGGHVSGARASSPQAVSCPGGALYCQLDGGGTAGQWINSQAYSSSPQYSNIAADDFAISTAGDVRSWQVSAVQVEGQYYDTANLSVQTASVRFYLNTSQNLPGLELYSGIATITPGSMASGDFYLELNPGPVLAAGGRYWISVQVTKLDGQGQWGWNRRVEEGNAPGAWRNPGGALGFGCSNWDRMETCYPSDGEGDPAARDLLFGLVGASSTVTSTSPVLTQINPPAGLNRDVDLALLGYNFAPGAVVSWKVGAGPAVTFTTTFQSATQLHAVIPAAFLTPNGQQATVAVVNAAPCAGTCASNTLPFAIEPYFRQYLPAIHR